MAKKSRLDLVNSPMAFVGWRFLLLGVVVALVVVGWASCRVNFHLVGCCVSFAVGKYGGVFFVVKKEEKFVKKLKNQ